MYSNNINDIKLKGYKMKKFLLLLISVLMITSLNSCGKKSSEDTKETSDIEKNAVSSVNWKKFINEYNTVVSLCDDANNMIEVGDGLDEDIAEAERDIRKYKRKLRRYKIETEKIREGVSENEIEEFEKALNKVLFDIKTQCF